MTGSGSVLLRARTVLTAADGEVITDGAVLVRDGRVDGVGSFAAFRDDADRIVDAGSFLMPGMIDAHSHLRGMPLPTQGIRPRPLETWLCTLSAMAPLDLADEAAVAAAELLETGVTAVQGFVHAIGDAESYRQGAAEIAAGVYATGIRALLVLGHTDRAERAPEPRVGDWALVPELDHPLDAAAFAAFAATWLADHPSTDLLEWGVGPVGPQWSSDAALSALASVAGAHRLHTHLNESRWQRDWLQGMPAPAARLAAAGLFDDRLSAAHAVHLTDHEIDLAAASGVALVHCPVSNRALSVGTARVGRWLQRGATAALGLDSQNSAAPDFFDIMREAIKSSKEIGDPLRADQVLAMATTGGGATLGVSNLGRLVPGAPADLIGLELTIDMRDVPSICAEIVERGNADAVNAAWIGGSQRVRDGRSICNTSSARSRLQATLETDASARLARLAALEPTLAAIERATAVIE